MPVRFGIKLKLVLALSAVIAFAASAVGLILVTHERASLEAQMRIMAATITDEFAMDAKIPLLSRDRLVLNVLVQNILKYPGIGEAYILNHKFAIEAHRHKEEIGLDYEFKESIRKAVGKPPWSVGEDADYITFASPILFKDTTVGYSVITFSNAFINAQLNQALGRLALIAALAIAAVMLLSLPLASRLIEPALGLLKGTKEIAMGNFDYRIAHARRDEIGALIDSFNNMAIELKKKEILKGAFSRYVNPHIAEEILKAPEAVRLGGERSDVTVFFTDIRGFTKLSRERPPEEVVEALNLYFTLITEVVFYFNGTVDKFIGDAVMNLFGAPVKDDRHLEQGVKAALAVSEAVTRINQIRKGRGLYALEIGVGLNSGPAIVGNMGAHIRMEYTAIGDTVNVASRLCSTAGGGEVVVTGDVYDLVRPECVGAEMPVRELKGLGPAVPLYSIRCASAQWAAEIEDAVKKALREYKILDNSGPWKKDIEGILDADEDDR